MWEIAGLCHVREDVSGNIQGPTKQGGGGRVRLVHVGETRAAEKAEEEKAKESQQLGAGKG